jgi:hypothetical protein
VELSRRFCGRLQRIVMHLCNAFINVRGNVYVKN